MSRTWLKRLLGLAAVIVVGGAAAYTLRPQPVPVDIAAISAGPLATYVEEEGVSRIRDVFRVSAPVAGKIDRFPLEVGERVYRGTTVVAAIRPTAPSFLDIRSRRELQAAAAAAAAAVDLAAAEVAAARAADDLARANLDRARRLAEAETISERSLQETEIAARTAAARLAQAEATLELRRSEVESAQARLIEPGTGAENGNGSCCVTITAPVDGVILDVSTESEQVVAAGTELLRVGDPRNLEIVVDLLSEDAVAVRPGARAEIFNWGTGAILPARVRRVDPAAFTKVSALGIEEQRVNAVLELLAPPAEWLRLGHEFRVMVRIMIWETGRATLLPLAALFRQGDEWHVFRVVDDRAVLTPVTIGHRDNAAAEVVDGLAPGDRVILHPSDRISDRTAVAIRP